MDTSRPRRFLSRKQQAARWSKSVKTVERWGKDPEMGLPPEYWLGNQPHRAEDELEAWERSRVGAVADGLHHPPECHANDRAG
jgi:hypothetical protein